MNYLAHYALSFLGEPYVWGGNHRFSGFDCSGFICELMRSVGVVKEDMSAQDLYDKVRVRKASRPQFGQLAFYGPKQDVVEHVAFVLNSGLCIEAGGGSRSSTRESSLKSGACVRIRPITYRKDLLGCWIVTYPFQYLGSAI